jgi:hypothetical protein
VNKFILTLFVALVPVGQAMSQVIATVSQNPAYAGQPFTLDVSADEDLPVTAFDASKLFQQKFVVGSTSINRNLSSINGKTTRQTKWTTTLMASEPGEYTIPALTINGEQTAPIKLNITAEPALPQDQQEVKLSVSIDRKSAYIQEPVIYTAELLVGSSLKDPELVSPRAQDALIEKLGDDRQDNDIIQGKRYLKITRQWLITPNQPGPLEILGPHLTGRALITNPYGRTISSKINLKGETKILDVKPQPAGFPGTWLAAQDLVVNEVIEPNQTSYAQGQAFTRTLTLTIAGVTETQLPELTLDYGDDFRVYQDQIKDKTIVKDGHFFAQRVVSLAIIPITSGTLTLPEIRIPWWDLKQDKLAWGGVTSHTISVTPTDNIMTSTPSSPAQLSTGNNWGWATLVFAALWLITLVGWGVTLWRRKRIEPVVQDPSTTPLETHAWQAFKRAAEANQIQLAHRYFSRWIHEASDHNTELARLEDELSESAWRPSDEQSWDGLSFLHRVMQAKKITTATKKDSKLPPLNP